MKKIFILAISLIINLTLSQIIISGMAYGEPLSGGIKEDKYLIKGKDNAVIDSSTGKPVPNATVSIPAKNISTVTNINGKFALNADLSGPVILSVKADGYKPFTLTINQNTLNKPITLGINKSGKELVIDSSLHHLGDDNFSSESANSTDFQGASNGPTFSKSFFVNSSSQGSNYYLKIGSVIGLDTAVAVKMRQSRSKSYSTPTIILLNNQKIGELRINGDNQEIEVPAELIKFNGYNQISLMTGKNVQPRSFVDYDDMEFMSLILEAR